MSISLQQKAFYKTFSQHGYGGALVKVAPKDIILLIHIAYMDVFEEEASWFIPEFAEQAKKSFYDITSDMVGTLHSKSEEEAIKLLQLCGASNTNNIIYLYLRNLSELYRRRFKFYNILKTQPFPVTENIGLRSLLEYGNCSDDLLFSWMSWRKWIYDIDNRSAQETGYLFEPVIASCLGGESVSHRNSPVKRISESGTPTNDGRQIDCYLEEEKEAYELKLRVTIAASGQGRFSEEMSFPYEARMAGLTPILIVFDSTPSALLEKLKAKYVEHGGRYAVGEGAWRVLTEKSGDKMGKYILKYIKPLITKMESERTELPANLHLKTTTEQLIVYDDNGNEYIIPRKAVVE